MKNKIIIVILCFLTIILVYNIFFRNEKYIIKNQKVTSCESCLIKNEDTAIKIAELILFDYYGEDKIKNERPYNIKLLNNEIWLITGSLNQGMLDRLLYKGVPMFGGTFEIKINAKNGAIINIIHYR